MCKKLIVSCNSDEFERVFTYENILNVEYSIDLSIPTDRVLKSRDDAPKKVNIFRSNKYISIYSPYSLLSWDCITIIGIHPIYRTKWKSYLYIEHSDYVSYTVSIT